ncbi:uncharacterized protein [Procambarus clarkii]|uniref:uncharacterized protein n=1 Tax=Procambarus clarkii TaxID=6728 RepID=UPI001E66FF5D|nr:uncharacterized protein LOC123771090 [Procambarus clarkii]
MMNLFRMMMVVAVATVASDAAMWPSWRQQPTNTRTPLGMRWWRRAPQQHQQEPRQSARQMAERRQPQSQSQGTLNMVRAATLLGLPDDPEFPRRLCQTTDVCPYSWQWMEGNILRAIVKWSLLK